MCMGLRATRGTHTMPSVLVLSIASVPLHVHVTTMQMLWSPHHPGALACVMNRLETHYVSCSRAVAMYITKW